MADSDEDRLRSLRSRQQGGAYQEAPLPAAAQQKLAAAGAGRNIRSTGTNSGAGPSRAVEAPRARPDASTGKHVVNLDTAAEQDVAAESAKKSAANAQVHLDPRAQQSPLYSHSGPQAAPGRSGLGSVTSSDAEWEGQVRSVSEHIKANHPHGGIGGVAIEYSGSGTPKPLSKDRINDLAERHLMGSARVPGLKAKSHEPAGEGERASDQPGLQVNPAIAARNNMGGAASSGQVDTREARQPRDLSALPAKSSSTSRSSRRIDRAAQYSENATEGQSRRDYYASNVPSANVTGSKTAQGVMHTERLSSPVNHGQFGKTAGAITTAVHSGLSAQQPPKPAPKTGAPVPAPKAEAPAVQPAAVQSSPQLGGAAQRAGAQGKVNRVGLETGKPKLGKDITYFGAPGGPKAPEEGKKAAPAYNTQQSYQKHIAGGGSPESYWQERDAKKAAPKPKAEKVTPAPVASAPEVPESGTSTPPVTAPTVSQPKTTPSRRPIAPQTQAPLPQSSSFQRSGVPAGGSGAGSPSQNPHLGQHLLSQPAVHPTMSPSSAPVAETVPTPQAGREPSRSRSPRSTRGANVPSPVSSGQFGEHHYHFYGNVNMGAGTQINGSVSDSTVSGGVEHGAPVRSPGSGSRGGRTGGRSGGTRPMHQGPVTGSPTGLQKLAYGAIHTSVNGHSIAGGVEHITGGGHLGLNDSQGRPIGHPHDDYVRHHPMNTQHGQLQEGQFSRARASRQQATPE